MSMMSKPSLRLLAAITAALLISCGGGGSSDGASSPTPGSAIVKDASAPDWGFAGQIGSGGEGGSGGNAGTGAGTSAGTSAGTGGTGAGAASGASAGAGAGTAGSASSGGSASASAGDTGGVGSGGTGASASAGDSGDSGVGGVGGVASIIVNGVRYDTARAVLRLRDAPQLQLGMTVKVNGPTNADFTAGEANEVESAADLRGLITTLNSGSGEFAVLGMVVSTDASTVWGNISGLGALAPGMGVQVWGLPAGPGRLQATRVEQRPATSTAPIISGVVQNLDASGRRFVLGGLSIDFAQAPPPPALADGVNVRVRANASPVAGVLGITSVELWYPVSVRDGTRRQLGGVVTNFGGLASFRVLGTPVDASSAQVSGGSASAIADGAELDVAGTVANGVLVATKVKIRKTPGGTSAASFTAIGTVGAFKSLADFKVKGQRIDASGSAVQFVNGAAGSLRNGTKVTVVGDRIVDDVLVATRVNFD